jgi:hypothetical protein
MEALIITKPMGRVTDLSLPRMKKKATEYRNNMQPELPVDRQLLGFQAHPPPQLQTGVPLQAQEEFPPQQVFQTVPESAEEIVPLPGKERNRAADIPVELHHESHVFLYIFKPPHLPDRMQETREEEKKKKPTMVLFGTWSVLGDSLMYSSIVPRNDDGG